VQSIFQAPWDDVRLFLALYRGRTLAHAGDTVGLDASTLSRRLGALEEALGNQLFDRTRLGLVPTAAAELLLPAAEEMAAAHARFSHDASAFERVTEGVVRLSAPPGLAEAFVAPALVRLRAKHPRIQIELDVSVRFVDLTRREADLAIRTRRPQTGDLVSVKLGERRWLPMIGKSSRKSRPIRDWAELPWIAWADDLATFPPAKWVAAHVPSSAIVLRTSQATVQLAAVEAGLGAALLPPALARVARVSPVRHAATLAASVNELPSNETWLVGHRALRAVPRVAATWAFLVEEFARYEPPATGDFSGRRASGGR
jgi:DNA-binding transcriptional LysR family regulator